VKTVFLRVLEAEDKAAALAGAVRQARRVDDRRRFEVDVGSFASVPGSPFAYWISEGSKALFEKLRPFESDGRFALGGLKTLTDERFVRTWWEVPIATEKYWSPLAKGGVFSRFYADVYLCVNWRTKGDEISWYGYQRRPREGFGAASRGIHAYFRPGLTWPRRTNGLSVRLMPAGCIFADKGPAAFAEDDNIIDLLSLASITNSLAFGLLVSLQLARTELAQSYEVGLIQKTPLPNLAESDREALAVMARCGWSLKRSIDTHVETSHALVLPALLQVAGDDVVIRAAAWFEHVGKVEGELVAIQAGIDKRCFELYGIDEGDRRTITEGFGGNGAVAESNSEGEEAEADDSEDSDEDDVGVDSASLAAQLVSWAVGVAFGRFDVRLATGGRALPMEPEPFDALPSCSPGMLTGEDGLPLTGPPAGYPLTFPTSRLLVEELRAFLDEVKRVAPLWNPNLDDGVIINFAPLWRLVPQNKAWQKELKSTWDALCEGKYDWAHLAMHLWPERVVPKCAKDRSLAIAHGLEDVFWVEGTTASGPRARRPRAASTSSCASAPRPP
jgi:hypothetical protein